MKMAAFAFVSGVAVDGAVLLLLIRMSTSKT